MISPGVLRVGAVAYVVPQKDVVDAKTSNDRDFDIVVLMNGKDFGRLERLCQLGFKRQASAANKKCFMDDPCP